MRKPPLPLRSDGSIRGSARAAHGSSGRSEIAALLLRFGARVAQLASSAPGRLRAQHVYAPESSEAARLGGPFRAGTRSLDR